MRFGDGGTVQLNEYAVTAETLGVDGASYELFAGTGLAINQHTAVRRRHQADLLAKRFDGDALAGQRCSETELPLEFQVLVAQASSLDRIFQDNQGSIERKWLFKKVIRPELGCLDRGLDSAVAGDDDNFRTLLGCERVNIGKDIEPIAVGEPDIEKDYIVGRIFDEYERFTCRGRRGHGVAFFRQNLFERSADLRLIVDHEDMVHECASETGVAPDSGSACSACSISGKRMTKRAPLGVLLSARMDPPSSCTSLAAIERPRPVPRCLVE